MKEIDVALRQKLWEQIVNQFVPAIQSVIGSQKKDRQKVEALTEITKVAFLTGLNRGYDMGFHVFGDGEDGE